MPSIVTDFPCTQCGTAAEYVPASDLLRCPGCQAEQPIAAPKGKPKRHSYGGRTKAAAEPDSNVTCPECGKSKGDSPGLTCHSCGASAVEEFSTTGPELPDAMLPFRVSKDSAMTAFATWISSRRFAPGSLKKMSRVELATGAYVPHWNFAAATETSYVGKRGHTEYDYVRSPVTDDKGNVTGYTTSRISHTVWNSVSGKTAREFSDLTVPACLAMMMGTLPEWPVPEAAPFQAERVAGFRVVAQDINLEEGFALAKKEVEKAVRADCKNDIGGEKQRLHEVSTEYRKLTYNLVLLPVWSVRYSLNGKQWEALVNGHTGEITGRRPYSVAKILATSLCAVAVIVLLVLALTGNL
jgi:hypothetical protein